MKAIYKFRLFPTDGQRTKLKTTLEGCRRAYNLCLQIRKDAYEYDGTTLGFYDTKKMVKDWRADDPVIGAVHTHVIQQVCERVHLAFEAFWRRCKAGENPGYPRFKSEERCRSFTFQDPVRGFRLIGDRTLRVSGVGDVRIKKHRPIPGKMKRLTIKRDEGGYWFACFHIDFTPEKLPVNEDIIGIDVGIENFATLSNGEIIENPRFLKRDRKRLAKLNRQFHQSPEGSERSIKKAKAKVKVWNKITNRRTNFAHQESRRLVDRFGIICVEDLDIHGMVSDGIDDFLNEGTHDVAWGRFISMLSYKAEGAGRMLIKVNPKNTSQICSGCGAMVPKDLGVRIHDCPSCGLKIHRDLNAALNIKRRGLTSLVH